MIVGVAIIFLIILFFLLGKAADIVVSTIASFSKKFGIKMYVLGIILAFFTSLPEITIAVNATINHIPDVSLGNLLGSILVIFGLVFGCSIMLNRKIKTDGKLSNITPILLYLFLPLLFGLDGVYTRFESALLIFWYVWVAYYLYRKHEHASSGNHEVTIHNTGLFFRDCFAIILASITLILLSSVIIRLTEFVLHTLHIQGFVVGLLTFSIGTNLPEIIVTLRAWKRGLRELSMSNLTGSAVLNPLIIGIFGFMQPYHIEVNGMYFNLMFFMALLLLAVGIFYRSGKEFSRKEGFMLLLIYLAFVGSEIGIFLETKI